MSEGAIITAIHETVYPRIKLKLTKKELLEIYTPNQDDNEFVNKHTRTPVSRLGLFVFLKIFQRLGYFPLLDNIPTKIISHIAVNTGLDRIPDNFKNYEKSGFRGRHIPLIRTYLKVKAFDNDGKQMLTEALQKASKTKDIIADIVNAGIEELVRQKFELPTFNTFVREAKKARSTVNKSFYSNFYEQVEDQQKILISDLLTKQTDETRSLWFKLKQEPKQPNTKTMREFVQHMNWLLSINQGWKALVDIPKVKLKRFADEAKSLNLYEINRITKKKRVTLVAALIAEQNSIASDDFTEMFVRQVKKIHNKGYEAIKKYRAQYEDRTDHLIQTLENITVAWASESNDKHRLKAVDNVIAPNLDNIIQQCKAHKIYTENKHIPFLIKPYKARRNNFFNFIDILRPKSTSLDKSLENAIEFLIQNRNSRTERLKVDSLDLKWIPGNWLKAVTGHNKRISVETVDRKYFEICLFSCVMKELKSGDLYIEDSQKFSDYRKELSSWDEFNSNVNSFCEQMGYSGDFDKLVNNLKQLLKSKTKMTDEYFPSNESVYIKDGEIIIRKLSSKKDPDGFAEINKLINDRISKVDLIDILSDTEHWLNWTSDFGLISGHDNRLISPQESYIITTFSYATYLGASQTSRSMDGVNRKHISYINKKHINVEKIERAITKTINQYNKFSLPKLWGLGNSASADGTKWDMYQRNLLSEFHIRYCGWGGLGYYHIADNYIALFSNFISCSVWEAVYILEGLLKNLSEIRPDTLHADTHGQSTAVFALAYLLGIKLMPRIKNWKDLKFFLADEDTEVINIKDLFSDYIDWKLIRTHLPEMLRIAYSITKGKVSSDTILRKLGTYSKKNKIYLAFRELGRVIRTIFLLDYLSDENLRRIIRTATIKSEEWNQFIDWIAFGAKGIIKENIREEQMKAIKYNHLVGNLIIFHNVAAMTNVLRDLKSEGYTINEDIISCLAPYRTEHINRFGKYQLRFDKRPRPLVDDINVLSRKNKIKN